MPEAETATASGTVVPVSATDQLGKFASFMAGRAKLEDDPETRVENAQEIQAQIAVRILSAKTEEEVWDADEGSMPGGRDLADVELRITGIDYKKSTGDSEYKSLFGGTYLIVHATRMDNGKESDFNTSAPGIVTKLVKFEQLGKFGDGGYIDAVIRNIDLGGGKNALKLRPVAARAI
jgi:hypothetical protein